MHKKQQRHCLGVLRHYWYDKVRQQPESLNHVLPVVLKWADIVRRVAHIQLHADLLEFVMGARHAVVLYLQLRILVFTYINLAFFWLFAPCRPTKEAWRLRR
jgi:hypothetical protein